MTKRLMVGSVPVGGGAPVSVQSMCNTKTEDPVSTLAQIRALAAAALREIADSSPVPLVADIHFDYRLALTAAESGMAAIRINPGNIGGRENVRKVAEACRANGLPIRIGINGGSLEKSLLEKYGGVTPEAMVESALGHVRLLNEFGFDEICLSLKCSDVAGTVAANRLAAERTDYPLHIGVTETGGGEQAVVKSAAGIGALLLEGIGDTLRVSLTGDPVREPEVGLRILRAVGLRRDEPDLIACPTCGRTEIDLPALYAEVKDRLKDVRRPLKVAVMGCVVNGPGEAAGADYGVAGGRDYGILFRKGERVGKYPADQLADRLLALIRGDLDEGRT